MNTDEPEKKGRHNSRALTHGKALGVIGAIAVSSAIPLADTSVPSVADRIARIRSAFADSQTLQAQPVSSDSQNDNVALANNEQPDKASLEMSAQFGNFANFNNFTNFSNFRDAFNNFSNNFGNA